MADEYIRKADVLKLLEDTEKELTNDVDRKSVPYLFVSSVIGIVMCKINMIKPADVVPVVRCKDCKHYYFADNRIPQEQRYVCEISGEIWKPDSFCSYGERREQS